MPSNTFLFLKINLFEYKRKEKKWVDVFHQSNVEYLMEFNFSLMIFHVLNTLHIILSEHFSIRSFWIYLLLIDFQLVTLKLLLANAHIKWR